MHSYFPRRPENTHHLWQTVHRTHLIFTFQSDLYYRRINTELSQISWAVMTGNFNHSKLHGVLIVPPIRFRQLMLLFSLKYQNRASIEKLLQQSNAHTTFQKSLKIRVRHVRSDTFCNLFYKSCKRLYYCRCNVTVLYNTALSEIFCSIKYGYCQMSETFTKHLWQFLKVIMVE